MKMPAWTIRTRLTVGYLAVLVPVMLGLAAGSWLPSRLRPVSPVMVSN